MAGQGQHKNDARNQKLYKDFKSGKFSVVELVHDYRISSARIYAIVKREQLKDEVLPLVGDDNKN
jgi:Mor family transcriptional regulator